MIAQFLSASAIPPVNNIKAHNYILFCDTFQMIIR